MKKDYSEEQQNKEIKEVLKGQKWICNKCEHEFYTKAQIYVSCPKCGNFDVDAID